MNLISIILETPVGYPCQNVVIFPMKALPSYAYLLLQIDRPFDENTITGAK